MKNQLFTVTLVVAMFSFLATNAQIKTPAPSPLATVTQEVGLTEIKITYSRPGVKGRKIFGDLVPYGKSWRTGANASTKISFSEDVIVEGNEVAAGTYALFTIPGKDEWTIVLHKNEQLMGDGGDDYKKSEEAARFTAQPQTLPESVETFTIEVADITLNTANIKIMWANTAVSFEVETEVDSKVMADIDRYIHNMDRNNSGMYFQAASYYYETGKDLDQALQWVNKATESNPDAFWMAHLKAKILAKQNKKKEAITAAEHAKALAQSANNADYVRLNENLITDLNKKK